MTWPALGRRFNSIRQQYMDSIQERAPVYCRHRFLDSRGKAFNYDRLVLPLGTADEVTHLLLGFHFRPWVAEAGQDRAGTPAAANV